MIVTERDRQEVIALEQAVDEELVLQEAAAGRAQGRKIGETSRGLFESAGAADRERDGRILNAFERSGLPRSLWSAALLAELRAARDDAGIRAILEDRRKVAELAGQGGAGGEPTEAEALDALRAASDYSQLPLPAPDPGKKDPEPEWADELRAGLQGDAGL